MQARGLISLTRHRPTEPRRLAPSLHGTQVQRILMRLTIGECIIERLMKMKARHQLLIEYLV